MKPTMKEVQIATFEQQQVVPLIMQTQPINKGLNLVIALENDLDLLTNKFQNSDGPRWLPKQMIQFEQQEVIPMVEQSQPIILSINAQSSYVSLSNFQLLESPGPSHSPLLLNADEDHSQLIKMIGQTIKPETLLNSLQKAQVPDAFENYFMPYSRSLRSSPTKSMKLNQTQEEKKFELSEEHKENMIQLKNVLDTIQPKKASNNGKNLEDFFIRDACCGTSTGYHKFFTSSQHSDVDRFGIGITLYFRFIKVLGFFASLFFILSIPQIIFSLESFQFLINLGADQGQGIGVYSKYTWLGATTISSIGENIQSCSVNQFNQGLINQYISCETGLIDFKKSFSVALLNKNYQNQQDCTSIMIPNQLIGYFQISSSAMSNYSQICDGQKFCLFNMSQSDISFNFTDGYNFNESKIYTNVYCKDSYVKVSGYQILKSQLSSIMAGFDIVIIILFIFMLMNLRACERDYIARAIFESPQIQYFTVQFSNLPHRDQSEEQLKAQLWEHIEKSSKRYMTEKKISGVEKFRIFDIKISQSYEELILHKKLTKKEILLAREMKSFVQVNNLEIIGEEVNLIKLKSLEHLFKPNLFKKAVRKFIMLQKVKDLIVSHNERIKTIRNKPQDKIKYLWATFLSQEQAHIASEAFKITVQERFNYFFLPQVMNIKHASNVVQFMCKYKRIKDGVEKLFLSVKPAPNPDNINWENLSYSTSSRNIRQILTWIITIIILILSFVIIVSISNSKSKIEQEYPSQNCTSYEYNNLTQNQVRNAALSMKEKVAYIDCFCAVHYRDDSNYQKLESDVKKICARWFANLFLSGLSIADVAFLILNNLFILFIFQKLTQFEKMEILSDEYTSRLLKIFLAQFLNTALILLIINASFNPNINGDQDPDGSQIFKGHYSNMNSNWYYYIGQQVLITIFTNLITTPLFLVIEIMIQKTRIIFCRGLDKLRNKNKTIKELVQLYIGPEFLVDLRYGQILNVIFVCMMYGAGMPILYLLTALTLVILYWTDKIWIFLFYKKPQNFDASITKRTTQILFFAIIIHCGFAIFIYGDQNNFYDKNTYTQDTNNNYENGYLKQFWQRLTSSQFNWPITIILGLTLLFFVTVVYFLEPFRKLLSGCDIFALKPITNDNYKIPLTHFLSTKQLENEVKVSQFRIEQLNEKEIDYKYLLIARQQHIIDFLNTPDRPHSKQQLAGIHSYDIAFNTKHPECCDWQLVENISIKKFEDDQQIKPIFYDFALEDGNLVIED